MAFLIRAIGNRDRHRWRKMYEKDGWSEERTNSLAESFVHESALFQVEQEKQEVKAPR